MCRIIDPVATGKNIRTLCKERGLSTNAIAKALSLSDRRTVFYWFSGVSLPTLDNLYMLSGLLDVPLEKLIIAQNKNEPPNK